MPCPKCGSDEISELEMDLSNPSYHIELYECNDCGTIFKWESTRTIVEEKNDDDDEFNAQLKKAREAKWIQRLIEEDEEE